ncbi:MAG TPA: FAD-dependent oxidoreductase, partial [Burkholderiales bacterium]
MNASVDSPGTPPLKLRFDLQFEDLYRRAGLLRVDAAFVEFLGLAEPALRDQLLSLRKGQLTLPAKQESDFLIAIARHVDDFIARLFGIEDEVGALSARHFELAPLYSCKRLFVQRKAVNAYKAEAAAQFDGAALEARLAQWIGSGFSELSFAHHVSSWLKDEAANADRLDVALRYAAWAVHTPAGQHKHHAGVLFKLPRKLDFQNLVALQTHRENGVNVHTLAHTRRRHGFALTDSGTDLVGALNETNYCIWCHEQERDSCSHGLKEKPAAEKSRPAFRKTVFGVPLAGCPLEERISEFQKLKTEGVALGALAMIALDNPMVAATGHRICNDCMKSCIYQKQDPVNIPQAETRTLKDVLELPWGFEIYSLLTRWNPLDLKRPYPHAPSGRRVLIAGLGPAGFTAAHHLMNDGHTVVGVDGLKIEPLPAHLGGVDAAGDRAAFQPIHDVESLYESLDDRIMAGFGGVAEYGITVRWDKNFLKLIRLLLQRREQFALFGGVRFGGTLDVDDAFALGFDHVLLAAGAGRPTVLDIPNGLAPGVRTASDFLMALQLTGAAKNDSIANMQLRLPVVVIGGGLTAIDTATESLAYYPLQVEKFLRHYEILCAEGSEDKIRAAWTLPERQIADDFLAHARAIRAERAHAADAGREAHVLELLKAWGGVTVAYRKRLIDS